MALLVHMIEESIDFLQRYSHLLSDITICRDRHSDELEDNLLITLSYEKSKTLNVSVVDFCGPSFTTLTYTYMNYNGNRLVDVLNGIETEYKCRGGKKHLFKLWGWNINDETRCRLKLAISKLQEDIERIQDFLTSNKEE